MNKNEGMKKYEIGAWVNIAMVEKIETLQCCLFMERDLDIENLSFRNGLSVSQLV